MKTEPILNALDLPNGARFYRCALQVNPFEYLMRHKIQSNYNNEAEYNKALVQACLEKGIEVIAITDHYRVRTAERLMAEAREAGIHVFPGFEAVTKDGVHFLCLFDPDKDLDSLERIIGDCGIHDEKQLSPTGKYDAIELLEETRKWGAICVAAHVASNGGLLKTLPGQSRINAWKHPGLLCCSLPGPTSEAPEDLRPILENKNIDYRREHPPSVINAQDVADPDDLGKPGASCWIKMSKVSIEGLRQAFLDPGSRIRLITDVKYASHTELVALTWQTAGFLKGAAIHFNENLNILIGGRGTGKSTIIESLRYVIGLEALGDEAKKTHEGIIRYVLKSGTKISLLVRSHRPNRQEYLIERTIPNPPIVRDQKGNILNLTPSDVVPQVEIYGQHEISELAKSPGKLTHLLERFMERDTALDQRKVDLARELERSRNRIMETKKELSQLDERLATLPALEESLKRFQKTGLEERLQEQSLLVLEEQILNTVRERIDPYKQILDELKFALPLDRAFLSKKSLDGLPGRKILVEADAVLLRLSQFLEELAKQFQGALDIAKHDLDALHLRWDERKKQVQEEYEKILRELQKTQVDGEEYIQLRRKIEELRPLRERQAVLLRNNTQYEEHRQSLLAEWKEVKAGEFEELQQAAEKVNKKLARQVKVELTIAGNREPLYQFLKDYIGGRLIEAIEAIQSKESFSLTEFVDACRAGKEILAKKYDMPLNQAERIANAPPEVLMRCEEFDLTPTTEIFLNVAEKGQAEQWLSLQKLSTGQKATALLLLLLLESDSPLIVDQPEDDLDNRFITGGIVPKMREEKQRRQFLFATHNANIPVLGDAELILGLTASGEATTEEGKACIPRDYMGSIDASSVREIVEEVLEGGRAAFETRRLKYGY